MSNFHFLKKDLEWKIVNLQCWGPWPTPPQPTNGTLSSSLLIYRSRKKHYILLNLDRVHTTHSRHSPPLIALPRLSSILVQERKYPFLGSPEMSGELRYEWQYVNTIPPAHLHMHRLLFALIFSLELSFKRENYTHAIIPPFGEVQKWVANWDMSGKSF